MRIVIHAVICLAAAAAAIGCGRQDDSATRSRPAASTPAATTAAQSTTSATTTRDDNSTGLVIEIEVEDRPPKPSTWKVRQGERVVLRIGSSRDEELHVHGYDEAVGLKAGRTVELSFDAKLAGVWEVELEESRQPLGSLVVQPA